MKWIEYAKQKPEDGRFLVSIRHEYPCFYWVGVWKQDDSSEPEDEPEYYIYLPELPKEKQ